MRGKTSLIRGHTRAYELRKLRACPLREMVSSLCPRLYDLLQLSDETFSSSMQGVNGENSAHTGEGNSSSNGWSSGGAHGAEAKTVGAPESRSSEAAARSATSWRMQLARAHTASALAPRCASISAESLDSAGSYVYMSIYMYIYTCLCLPACLSSALLHSLTLY